MLYREYPYSNIKEIAKGQTWYLTSKKTILIAKILDVHDGEIRYYFEYPFTPSYWEWTMPKDQFEFMYTKVSEHKSSSIVEQILSRLKVMLII